VRALWARLLVGLTVATLVGLLVAYAAFLFWAGPQAAATRRLAMQAALLDVSVKLPYEQDAATLLKRVAAQYRVGLALTGADGSQTVTEAWPVPVQLTTDTPLQQGAYEYLPVRLAGGRFVKAVAWRRRADGLEAVLASARPLLLVLGLVGTLIVALAALFLRRTVIRPLTRLSTLLAERDHKALAVFGSTAGSDVAGLSRSIIAMTQTIQEDRREIARQLDELRLAHARLEQTQEHLVRAERLAVVGQLAAGLAHEIGNPLTVVAGFVDVLKDCALSDSERGEALSRMAKELRRMHATVRSLLDYSRASRAGDELGNCAAAIEHLRKLLASQERWRRIELRILAPDPALRVAVGTDALTQLLLNLLLNAADAITGQGTVALAARPEGEQLILEVDDSGPGVPLELRRRIFDPFFTTKPAGTGTGLGLAVCERIVTSAGGDIRVEQSPLGGARFRISLPRAAADRPGAPAAST
jgi:two-component system, NtrC family, sensor kinase